MVEGRYGGDRMILIKCCYKCPVRHEHCHSHCKRYKDEKAAGEKKRGEYVVEDYASVKHNRIAHELYRGKKT